MYYLRATAVAEGWARGEGSVTAAYEVASDARMVGAGFWFGRWWHWSLVANTIVDAQTEPPALDKILDVRNLKCVSIKHDNG